MNVFLKTIMDLGANDDQCVSEAEREVVQKEAEDLYKKHISDTLLIRSAKIELLSRYTKFLQKNGYIDTDATCEPPFAIDEFLKTEK